MTVTHNGTPEVTTTPAWSGINHLALITTDMDATVRFYHGVLGARLVATLGTPEFRHYFFEFGPHCTVAFFEYADPTIEPFAKPAGVPDPRATQFDHLALNLPDENALHDLRRRLTERRLRSHRHRRPRQRPLRLLHRPQRHRPRSVLVGSRRDRPTADYDDDQIYGDPNPVPALHELRTGGPPPNKKGHRRPRSKPGGDAPPEPAVWDGL